LDFNAKPANKQIRKQQQQAHDGKRSELIKYLKIPANKQQQQRHHISLASRLLSMFCVCVCVCVLLAV